MTPRAQTAGALALLTAALPFNAAWTAVALARGRRPARAAAARPRTVMLSGGKMTKALQLARSFHAAGHRVVLVESARYRWTGHRFSRAVDAFHVVADATDPGYAAALRDVAVREGVDVYVPVCSPASSVPDAEAKALLEEVCEVVHPDVDAVRRVDDKDAFAGAAAALDLPVPDRQRVESADEVAAFAFPQPPYVLKSIPYDAVHRLDLTPLPRATVEQTRAFAAARSISPETPWVLQSFVEGTEYCTHSTVRDGRVQLHCCCASSAFQVNYEHVDKPEIEAWVRTFVADLGVTGQLSFDFIEGADGRSYAIECNPRTHSAITMFYDHPGVADAYLEDNVETVTPTAGSRPTYWLYHELWRALTGPARVAALRRVVRGKDAIFDRADPLPFLLVPHLQIAGLLVRALWRGDPWVRIDFNIGKLVQPAGD